MRIFIVNPKGGSGKTTLATNIAGLYARMGEETVLVEHDKQRSTFNWLQRRPSQAPKIKGIFVNDLQSIPVDDKIYITDTPAGLEQDSFVAQVRPSDLIIIPVLPSPIDMHAAGQLIYQLTVKHRLSVNDAQYCLVANRARPQTLAYQQLFEFLNSMKIPFVTTLRDSINYVKAFDQGLSIFDFDSHRFFIDQKSWQPLLRWMQEKHFACTD